MDINLLFPAGRAWLVLFWASLFVLLPGAAVGNCTCDPQEVEYRNKSLATNYKAAAIASILGAGALGVCIPVLGRRIPGLSPERSLFFVVKAFAAGVILSTGFIHVLPDAFDSLTSPQLSKKPWRDFPLTGFIAMLAGIGTFMVDTYATSYYRRRARVKTESVADGGDDVVEGALPVHTHSGNGHAHGGVAVDAGSGQSELLRHRVISQVLELGIIVHSVIIGVALGASQNPNTIRPLIVALTFHQFFEGIGLGGCISQAKFGARSMATMALFFSITTPAGIAIGIGISNVYSEDNPNTLIVEGILNAASAGILIYMALVDLLATDFSNPKLQSNGKLQSLAITSLLVGSGCMAMLAIWA